MQPIDWAIVAGLVALLTGIGIYTKRYTQSVADFLGAGRIAGRYMLTLSEGIAGMGLISVVATWQWSYEAGLTAHWWGKMGAPLGLLMMLSGWVIYRYRETRALTLAQFFEARYSRGFRLYAATLCWVSGVINYGVFPAVAANFYIHFCGLPETIPLVNGWEIPTFNFIIGLTLGVAVLLCFAGGQIAIMVTDFTQAMFMNAVGLVILLYLVFNLIDFQSIQDTLLAHSQPGKSMLHPMQAGKHENFSWFYFFVGAINLFYNARAWQGSQAYNCAAKSAHEAKMAGILGKWREMANSLMWLVIPIMAFTVMHYGRVRENVEAGLKPSTVTIKEGENAGQTIEHPTAEMTEEHRQLVLSNAPTYEKIRQKAEAQLDSIVPDEDPLARERDPSGWAVRQQMTVPVVLSLLLPPGLVGAFVAVMLAAQVSTDDTYLHSWGSIFIQDVYMPFRSYFTDKPMSVKGHLWGLRLSILFVAVFAFFFSSLFNQPATILMFFAITGAVFLNGAGSCIIGGLYWKRGNTYGAYAAMTVGLVLAVVGFMATRPEFGFVQAQDGQTIARYFAVQWGGKVVANFVTYATVIDEFTRSALGIPWNAQFAFFVGMLCCSLSYVVVSLVMAAVTLRPPHNMDRLLHRGKYVIRNEDGSIPPPPPVGLRAIAPSKEFSRGDKVFYFATMFWSLGWFTVFLVGTIVGLTMDTKVTSWIMLFKVELTILFCLGVAMAFWFLIGGLRDMKNMFKTLATMKRNYDDDGRVIGHRMAGEEELVTASGETMAEADEDLSSTEPDDQDKDSPPTKPVE